MFNTTISKELLHPATPIERVGLLFQAGGCLLLLALALHWNIADRLFIYRQTYVWTLRVPQPSESTQGMFWRETSSGWHLYTIRCIEEERRKSTLEPMVFNLLLPEGCVTRFVPHNVASRTEWRQSLGEFWRELVRGRLYTSFALFAIGLLLVGGFLCAGLVTKLVLWVKNGWREA